MTRDKDKDPWNTGLLRTPSPASSDADEFPSVNGFIQLTRDNDLANELDLSRREDHAIVKETPFTLAKLRAQQHASKSNPRDESRSGGPIRTADGRDAQPSSTNNAPARTSAPKKRRVANTGWTDSNGAALDAGPITKKGKRGVQSEVKSKPPRKEPRKEPAPAPVKAAPKRKPKRKNNDDDKVEFHKLPTITSHADFPIIAGLERQRSLSKKKPAKKADATSSQNPPAKRTTTAPRAGPSKSRQTKLDLDALIGGYSYKGKGKARAPPRSSSAAETESTDLDLAAALEKEFGPLKMRGTSKPVSQSKLFTSTAGSSKFATTQSKLFTPTAASAEAHAGPSGASALDVVDLTTPDSSTIKDSSPNQGPSSESVGPTTSTKPTGLIRPVAVRPGTVQLLESLAAEHDLPDAKFKEAARLPGGSRRSQADEKVFDAPPVDNTYQPPMRDVETAFLMRHGMYPRPNLDEERSADGAGVEWDSDILPCEQQQQRRPTWQHVDRDDVPDYRRDVYDASEQDWQPGPSRGERDLSTQGWRKPSDGGEHGLLGQDWPPNYDGDLIGTSSNLAPGHRDVPQQSPNDTYDAWGRSEHGDPDTAPSRSPRYPNPNDLLARDRAVHGVSMRAPTRLPTQQYGPSLPPTHQHQTFTSDAYRTPLRAPVHRSPPSPDCSPTSLADPRLPITPASAYTQSKRRERKPLAGSWHKVLGSPSPPPAPEEWSTLPPKRRQRITMHPDASRPKSSKFRLPINLLSGRKLPSQQPAPPASSPPSQPSESPLYTGPVTITKWTPSALSQPPVAESSKAAQRGYVPPNMRALERMGESSSPEQRGYYSNSTPQRSAQPAPYFTPQQPRIPNLNPYPPQPPGASAYATPRSFAPGPSAGLAEEDDDDWAAAWRLSANGKGAVGASGGR